MHLKIELTNYLNVVMKEVFCQVNKHIILIYLIDQRYKDIH